MSPATIRRWSLIHKWTSLISTVFLLILCLTGLPLIFREEIGHWLNPPPAYADLPADTPMANVDPLVGEAMKRHPDRSVMTLFFDDDEPRIVVGLARSWHDFMAGPGQRSVVTFDSRTGAVLRDSSAVQQPGAMLLYILLTLHQDLFAGLPGALFMGTMGLCFVAALISGVVLYAPFMRRAAFGTIRTHRSARAKWLDIHNLLGAVLLAWTLVVGATGVMNELAKPLFTLWQQTQVQAMLRPWQGQAPPVANELGSPQGAYAAAQHAMPGMRVMSVVYPGGLLGSAHHYMVWAKGNTPLTSRLFSAALVDARTGTLTAVLPMPWYLRALEVSRPLHFGDYGGLPLKIIWALLDLATIAMLVSGLYLWLRPRRTPTIAGPVFAAELAE